MNVAYTPYGYLYKTQLFFCLAFNGHLRDAVMDGYLLGNGYRCYHPVLMRFTSPDVRSPMGAGGFNAYAYCKCDPINYFDPHGRLRLPSRVAHAINSKVKRNLFDAGKRTPFSGLGMGPEVNVYKFKREFKAGNVEGVVSQTGIGFVGDLMDRYPKQAKAIMIEVTQRAWKDVVSFNHDSSASQLQNGVTGLAALDAKNLAVMRSGVRSDFSKFGLTQLAESAVAKGGGEMETILSNRLRSLREDRLVEASDWYAEELNRRFPVSS